MKIRAKVSPFYAPGGGVALDDENGRIIGKIALVCLGPDLTESERLGLAQRIAAAINAGQAERQVTHTKTGGTYDVVASEAVFQVSAPSMGDGKTAFQPRCRVVEDGSLVTIYRNPEGMHFVRFPDEVVSPRFEEVKS